MFISESPIKFIPTHINKYKIILSFRFAPGTPASSTTKTGHHDIAESGIKQQKSIKKKSIILRLIIDSLQPFRFVIINYKKN